jgi:hypothetical protein
LSAVQQALIKKGLRVQVVGSQASEAIVTGLNPTGPLMKGDLITLTTEVPPTSPPPTTPPAPSASASSLLGQGNGPAGPAVGTSAPVPGKGTGRPG